MAKLLNSRKGIAWRTVAAVIVVVAVLAFILSFLSSDARALYRDLIGLKPEDATVWTRNCQRACDDAKMTVTKCPSTTWESTYCTAQYNSTTQCGEAEVAGLIDECTLKKGKNVCRCEAG